MKYIAVIGLLFFSTYYSHAQNTEKIPSAEQFVLHTTNKIIEIISIPDNCTLREQKLSNLFEKKLSIRKISQFTLGSFARKISKEDFDTYQNLIKKLIIRIYATRLHSFSGEKIVILGHQQKKNNTIVTSQIQFKDRDPIRVNWWLRKKPSSKTYKIFDLQVLGIWMVQEQRDVFSAILRKNNGNIKILLHHLQNQINTSQKCTI